MKRTISLISQVVAVACVIACTGYVPAYASESIVTFLDSLAGEENLFRVKDASYNLSTSHAIIILEDAHCNVPIQQKLMAILRSLFAALEQQRVVTEPLVLQEGGARGVIDTSVLRQGKTNEAFLSFLDEKRAHGEIGAAEFLHAAEGGFTFYGIEDTALYDANYDQFMHIAEKRDAVTSLIQEIDEKMALLRPLIFSDELEELFVSMQNETASQSFEDSVQKLKLRVLQYTIDMRRYPLLSQWFETIDAIGKLHDTKLARELQILARQVQRDLALDDTISLLHEGIVTIDDYPELYKFARFHTIIAETNMFELVKEKEALEKKLLIAVAYSDEEKEFVDALEQFSLLRKILSCTLKREEYHYYVQQRAQGEDLITPLTDYLVSYYPSFSVPTSLRDVQRSAERFYQIVGERDATLATNMAHALTVNNEVLAVAVIGGFHTDGITYNLKQQGLSYMVLTPLIQESDDRGLDSYYQVMKRFWKRP